MSPTRDRLQCPEYEYCLTWNQNFVKSCWKAPFQVPTTDTLKSPKTSMKIRTCPRRADRLELVLNWTAAVADPSSPSSTDPQIFFLFFPKIRWQNFHCFWEWNTPSGFLWVVWSCCVRAEHTRLSSEQIAPEIWKMENEIRKIDGIESPLTLYRSPSPND